jgi:hypothetical protein
MQSGTSVQLASEIHINPPPQHPEPTTSKQTIAKSTLAAVAITFGYLLKTQLDGIAYA